MTKELSSTYCQFPSGDITLEGELHLPEGKGTFPAVVVCHPHPLYGGSMINNIVLAICYELSKSGIAALRFNFRGVGMSGGTFSGGIGEQADVKAAIEFVFSNPKIDNEKIGLSGYSFGAAVALPVAVTDNRISQLALISPALEAPGWQQLKDYIKAKLIIVGDADFTVSQRFFQQFIEEVSLAKQPHAEIVSAKGADHFWMGFESEVAEKVADFFSKGFQADKLR